MKTATWMALGTRDEYMTRAGYVDTEVLDDIAEFMHVRRGGQR